jgi:CDP-glycerol:poly(glycerophosphate) glycerophosphotransferase
LILPRTILVLDEEARRRAIAEGLPEDRLDIRPNPHLVYLAGYWRPRRDRAATRRLLGLGEQAFVILYAPDPIRMRDPDGRRGFDEISATRDLLAGLASLGDDVQVLAKLHPLQPAEPMRVLLASSAQVVVAAQTDVPELIHASDVVVGFFSNLLLEADALQRPVVRYYPGDRASDPLAHLALGTRVGSVGELSSELGRLRAEALKTRS